MAKNSRVTPSVNGQTPPAPDASDADWAAFWYELGVAVIPLYSVRDDGTCRCGKPDCASPGKHPYESNFAENSGRARFANVGELREFWRKHGPLNVGAATGHIPHADYALAVTDEDDVQASEAVTEAATWAGALDTVEGTLRQRSAGRGRPHRIFACPSETFIKSGKRSTMKGETPEQWGGLDVKSEGGLVVLAGSSVVKDGERRRYTLDNPQAPILPLPEALVGESSPFVIRERGSSFEERQRGPAEGAQTGETVEPDTEEGREAERLYVAFLEAQPVLDAHGERNNTVANVLAPRARDLGIPWERALDLIDQHWNGRDGQAPLDRQELETATRSGWTSAEDAPGRDLDMVRARLMEPAEHFGAANGNDPTQDVAELGERKQAADEAATAGVQDVGPKLLPCYLEGELDALPAWSYLIDDVLPERSLHMVHGQPDALKTFTALDLVMHGAAGRSWPSQPSAADWTKPTPIKRYKPARQLRVAYLATEGVAGLRKRVRAWKQHHGIEQDLAVAFLPDCPTLDSLRDLNSVIHTLKHVLGTVDWVVVDTLFGVAGELDVTKAPDSSILVKRFKAMMAELGCSLTIIHHDVKGSGGFFGSQVWYASVDAMDECKSQYLGPGVRGVVITNEKTKDETKRPAITLNARVEDLGLDDRGRRQSTLVLVADLQMAQKTEEQQDPDANRLNIALDLLEGQRLAPVDWLAESIAAREQGQERFANMSDGDKAKMTDSVKRWLRREAKNRLASYANKASSAQNAPWEFCDPKLTPIRKGG